jgi:hypothetical protein
VANVPPPAPQIVPYELLGEFSLWDSENDSYIRPSPKQHKVIFIEQEPICTPDVIVDIIAGF